MAVILNAVAALGEEYFTTTSAPLEKGVADRSPSGTIA